MERRMVFTDGGRTRCYRRCHGVTKNGTQCRHRLLSSGNLCTAHENQKDPPDMYVPYAEVKERAAIAAAKLRHDPGPLPPE